MSIYNIYQGQSYLKWLALITSLIIGIGSISYTNGLVKEIRNSEKHQIDLYAKTLEYLASENDSRNLVFIMDEIVQANTTIPVILTDENEQPEYHLNIPELKEIEDPKLQLPILRKHLERMRYEHDPIVVNLTDNQSNVYGKKFIFYENSSLLVRLKYYPYVQLGVISLFVLITFVIFNYSRMSEQNRVWVGLAKETAHQLGTPLTSLMAWVVYLKTHYPKDENLIEMDKDVSRLEMITSRFSNIGSVPKLSSANIIAEIEAAIQYLRPRLSKKVNFQLHKPDQPIQVLMNHALFSWVLENLIKNAVDAMNGEGDIGIAITQISSSSCAIDVSDTGKGISPKIIKRIFKPGYTSKQRGWGLGLTLVKRIVENYHGGKIFVKKSEIGKGTTFRIILKTDATYS